MLEKIIGDVYQSLLNKNYIAALMLSLTIPDICGNIQQPDAEAEKRYVDWYNENAGKYKKKVSNDLQTGYLCGKIIYELKNALMDQAKSDTGYEFILLMNKKNEFDIHVDKEFVKRKDSESDKKYEIDARKLCLTICSAAKRFYDDNKKKFDTFNFTIEYRDN